MMTMWSKVEEVIQIAAAAADCQGNEDSGKNWVGPLPYLRLIHCLLEDDIRNKWIHRNDPRSIQEIDARNSEVRVETAFEMIASRWNLKMFNPKMMLYKCHYDFKEEHDVGHKACSEFARATALKVKDKLARMKTDLTTIIQNGSKVGKEMVGSRRKWTTRRTIWNNLVILHKQRLIGAVPRDGQVHLIVVILF
jgi:hypothetical protein